MLFALFNAKQFCFVWVEANAQIIAVFIAGITVFIVILPPF